MMLEAIASEKTGWFDVHSQPWRVSFTSPSDYTAKFYAARYTSFYTKKSRRNGQYTGYTCYTPCDG